MLEHRRLRVRLLCHKRDLEEFAVKVEDERTISCYVPSEAGMTFCIAAKSNLDTVVVTECYVDGHYVVGMVLDSPKKCTAVGPYVAEDAIKPFQFVPLAVTDDETIANHRDPRFNDLGTVELRFPRAIKMERLKFRLHWKPPRGPVHERCKKAGTHRVSYVTWRLCDAWTTENIHAQKTILMRRSSFGTDLERYCRRSAFSLFKARKILIHRSPLALVFVRKQRMMMIRTLM